MNIRFLLFLILISLCPNTFTQKSLFLGGIQFPQSLKRTPGIRVYYAGKKIPCETDHDAKRLLFTVSEQKYRSFFYLLVTPEVDFICKDNNVEHLTLKPGAPYKLYALQLIEKNEEVASNDAPENAPASSKQKKPRYAWSAKEIHIFNNNGKIPDDAIIICYDPRYVDGFEGGSAIEFPKVVIRPDVVSLAGSEEKLQDQSTRWLLAALHTDMIHETMGQEIKFNPNPKTIIAI